MATKRGICNHCTTSKITNRIFQVNPEATVCYCPNCMHEMEPQEAITNYVVYIDNLNRKADDTLFVACNPALAYQQFADVIEIDNTNTHAYLGRLICLVYMSKVRTTYLNEAKTLLSEESKFRFHKADLVDEYLAFLRKVNDVLDEYEVTLHKRLTFRNFFYDEECLRLYLKHLNEIINMKEVILDELKYVRSKKDNQDVEILINLLVHTIGEKNDELRNQEHITTSGQHFVFEKVKRSKDIEIAEVPEKFTNTFTARYRMASLDPEDKKKRHINDQIFKDYTNIINNIKSSLAFMIIYALIFAGAGIVAAIFRGHNLIFMISIVVGGIFLLAFILTLIFRLSWKRIIKKRKLAAS